MKIPQEVRKKILLVGQEALMGRSRDWQGTTGPGFSLQEPDWPQEDLALSLSASVIKAITEDPTLLEIVSSDKCSWCSDNFEDHDSAKAYVKCLFASLRGEPYPPIGK